MNKALWFVQALLALAFLMGGLMKATTPCETLSADMPWVVLTMLCAAELRIAQDLSARWLDEGGDTIACQMT